MPKKFEAYQQGKIKMDEDVEKQRLATMAEKEKADSDRKDAYNQALAAGDVIVEARAESESADAKSQEVMVEKEGGGWKPRFFAFADGNLSIFESSCSPVAISTISVDLCGRGLLTQGGPSPLGLVICTDSALKPWTRL